jgi:hypothetical protein
MSSTPLDKRTGPVPGEGANRDVAEAGTLPDRRPDNMWAGRSAGTECAICGAAVSRDEMEYELEYARNGPDWGVDTYHVHIPCFTARISKVRDWEAGGSAISSRRRA